MFKSTNDKPSGRLAIDADLSLPVNSDSTVMQFTINTDATVGTITFSYIPRNSKKDEPVFREDGTTQVVVDLSTTERTIFFEEGLSISNIIGSPAGLNGTFYEVTAASGDR